MNLADYDTLHKMCCFVLLNSTSVNSLHFNEVSFEIEVLWVGMYFNSETRILQYS